MKYRTFGAIVAVIAFAGTGTAVAAGPARAATAASSHICLKNAPAYCIQSNGPGNQVTITNGSSANFQVVSRIDDGSGMIRYQFENGAGNCLRYGTGGIVKIENGPCGGINSPADWWVFWSQSNQLTSYKAGCNMLTRAAANDQQVLCDLNQPGDWVQWTIPDMTS